MSRLALVALLCLVALPAWGGVEFTVDAIKEDADLSPGAFPITVVAWIRVDQTTSDSQQVVWFTDISEANNYIGMSVVGLASTGLLQWYPRFFSGPVALSASALTEDRWHLIGGVSAASNSHIAYLDGVGGTESTTSITWSANLDTTSVGGRYDSSPDVTGTFTLAHLVVWDVALTAADMLALAAGAHPLTIKPESITRYFPLHGDGPPSTRIRDVVGGAIIDDTLSASPAKGDSPPIRPLHGVFYGTRLDKPLLLSDPLNIRRCREEDYA